MTCCSMNCCCMARGARIRLANLIPLFLVVFFAILANIIMPVILPLPIGPLLLALWLLAAIPPTSFFGATIFGLVLGYLCDGCRGLIAVGCLSCFGLASVLAAAFSVHAPLCGHVAALTSLVSKVFRLISSTAMAMVWSLPPPLTLAPRLLFVLYFEPAVLIAYNLQSLILKLCARLGCYLNDEGSNSVEGSALDNFPVLLVHGLGGTDAQWLLGRLSLRNKSRAFSSIFMFNYSLSDSEGIDEIAHQLSERVKVICEETGAQKLALIGHSVGGLVCSHFADNYAAELGIEVPMVICISTPWTGVVQCRGPRWLQEFLLCAGAKMSPKMREDLQGESELLRKLQERQLQSWSNVRCSGGRQNVTRYYNLAGSLDALVLPSKHIISKNAFWSCWLPHVGHHSILMSETLWDQVMVWASTGRASVKSAGGHEAAAAARAAHGNGQEQETHKACKADGRCCCGANGAAHASGGQGNGHHNTHGHDMV